MFRTGADDLTLEAAQATVVPLRRRPVAYLGRAAAAIVATAALAWTGLTSGVEMAAAAVGAGVAHPGAGATMVAYVGVRLNASELADRAIADDLQRMDLTAIVDSDTALLDPQALRTLAGIGVDVASGGRGDWPHAKRHDGESMLWTRARADATAGELLEQLTGLPVTVVVPGRRVNAWDLIDCGDTHSSLVVPNHVVNADRAALDPAPLHLSNRQIYLINGLEATPAELASVLNRLAAGLIVAQLTALPLDTLA
jgi:hypothetical protein